MDETLKAQHGETVAKIYEDLKTDLSLLNEKYQNLKNKYGIEQRAGEFYRFTIEPTNLKFDDDIPIDLKQEVTAIFDKHLKPKGN